MARAIIPLVVVGAIAVGLYVFWNPTICTQLNQLTAGQFDMCSFQQITTTGGGVSPGPGLTGGKHPHVRHRHTVTDTTVSSPAHQKSVAQRHQQLATHNNAAIHAAHKQLQKKHAASGNIKANQIGSGGPHCESPICKQAQCAGCPPPTHDANGNPLSTTKANLAELSHYRISYN